MSSRQTAPAGSLLDAATVLACAQSPLLLAVFSDLTGDGTARAAFGAFFDGVGALWVAVIDWVISAARFPAAFAMMAASFAVAAVMIALARCPQ
ncbi:MAG: hypothetical protein ACRDOK_28880 [Streptosporangiaceae bacterium]